MTTRTSRVLVATLATALAATSLGCGLIDKAKDIVGGAQVLSDFADRLGKASTLTYTAEYTMTGGERVTLVQQPPNTAFIGKDGRLIATAESLFFCGTEQGAMVCQKSPNGAAGAGNAATPYVGAAMGPGFVTPELAVGLIAAAILVPGAEVTQSERTVGGEDSLCATASNLDAAAEPGVKDSPTDFSVCVTEAGILSYFSGATADGESAEIELVKYSAKVDAKAFAPPAGAQIVDVTQIEPK